MLLAVPLVFACSQSQGPPAISVDNATVLLSDPVHITVSGLSPGEDVTISAKTVDDSGHTWASSAVFTADQKGDVDVKSMKPKRGSYAVVDGMGLFWSMTPSGSVPLPQGLRPSTLTETDELTVTSAGGHSSTTVGREYVGPGVTETSLRTPQDAFFGDYFAPADHSKPMPGILLLGGSGGGIPDLDAAQLASHGFPALALAYFLHPGLPQELRLIPLEYFLTALRWLRTQPGVDPNRLVVYGSSRGGEAALLIGATYPDVVHAVVALVPSAWVNGSYPTPGYAAWTVDGRPVPYTGEVSDAQALIPVSRINGPLLLECGGLDAVWISCGSTDEVKRELATGFEHPIAYLRYPDGGHGVGEVVPYYAGQDDTINQGRTPSANPVAREHAWPSVVAFLRAFAS